MHNPINRWPVKERPREKLIQHGATSLSSAELLAILISTGTVKRSALEIGKDILNSFGSLENIANASFNELVNIDGLGEAKALKLLAAFQISRNMQEEVAKKKFHYCKNPLDVANIFIPKIGHRKQEVFAVALLDSAGKYIKSEIITIGTLNSSLIHPREVFRPAIIGAAASIILVHNHPSGNLDPSKEDLNVTQQLVESGKLIEIPVQDHLIIAQNQYYSFREHGYI
jgi:DNA repair protein RadC